MIPAQDLHECTGCGAVYAGLRRVVEHEETCPRIQQDRSVVTA